MCERSRRWSSKAAASAPPGLDARRRLHRRAIQAAGIAARRRRRRLAATLDGSRRARQPADGAGQRRRGPARGAYSTGSGSRWCAPTTIIWAWWPDVHQLPREDPPRRRRQRQRRGRHAGAGPGDGPGGAAERTVIFAAFTGEESGRRGSRYYAWRCPAPAGWSGSWAPSTWTPWAAWASASLVLGGASAREWVHIAMGCSYVTGGGVGTGRQELDSSDQVSFIARNIPAVQLFAGPHADYHRLGDTADRVDAGGLVKVAAFAREAVRYLAERAELLTRLAPAAASPAAAAPARGNDGPVAPPRGSPCHPGHHARFRLRRSGGEGGRRDAGLAAAGAGIRPGDVITALDGQAVTSLAEYAAALRARQPGDTVTVTLRPRRDVAFGRRDPGGALTPHETSGSRLETQGWRFEAGGSSPTDGLRKSDIGNRGSGFGVRGSRFGVSRSSNVFPLPFLVSRLASRSLPLVSRLPPLVSPVSRLPVSRLPIHPFTDSPTHRFTDSPTHRFTDSPIHRLTVPPPVARSAGECACGAASGPSGRFA